MHFLSLSFVAARLDTLIESNFLYNPLTFLNVLPSEQLKLRYTFKSVVDRKVFPEYLF